MGKVPPYARRVIILTFIFTAQTFAQEYAGSLTVTVTDPSGALIPGARIVIRGMQRETPRESLTDSKGSAVFEPLAPDQYSLEALKQGFETVRIARVNIGVRDRQNLNVEMKISTETTSVSVTDHAEGVTTDSSTGISVDQDYIQNLPVNGRNAQALVLMAPGITTATGPGGGPGGGFNANGQRSNTNYFTVDGVSTNSSIGGGGPSGFGGPPGPGGGGPPPGVGGGGSDSLISLDAMQEMRIQTSSFAPEFGRSPGAQVSITSRGGGNAFHGSAFYYFRNQNLDANDWFANSRGFNRGQLKQNRPGGTVGGPIIKNRTFFFVSLEENRLNTPLVIIGTVPDNQSRLSAPFAIRPFLNAFPIANGAEQDNGGAEFHAVVANPSHSDSASLRLDQVIDARSTLFARVSLSPNTSDSRGAGLSAANIVVHQHSEAETGTVGWTYTKPSGLLNDIRINYSHSVSTSSTATDSFGGAVPLTDSQVFPKSVTSANGQFSLSVLGVGSYSIGSTPRSQQDQINVVDSVTKTARQHTLKTGVDYRRIFPTNYRTPYTLNVTFNGMGGDKGGLSSGVATNVQVTSNLPAVYPAYTNFSAYIQDTWRATDRTTLTYGLRWDVNPAPGVRQGPKPLAQAESTIAGVTQNDPLYATRWFDVAPRIGLAYQMDTTQGHEMMMRMGFGLFHDIGYGTTAGVFGGAPYSNVRTISLAQFPLASSDETAPVLPPVRPYGQITAADRNLASPRILQWNFTLERNFGRGQTLSMSYVGTQGRQLLRTESQPSFGTAYNILMLATNGATSDYHGLQVQLRRRFSDKMQTQLSYTWAHSIDSSSNDIGGGFASLFTSGQRGNSDFDIRQNLSWSGTYLLWAPGHSVARRLLGNWNADWVVSARTSLPFDVQSVTSNTSDSKASSSNALNLRGGLFAQVRPDYTGAPVWISDRNAPGGKRLNPDAFAIPDGFTQGNLGRNSLRGFGFSQLDLSLRRQLVLSERFRLNISAEAYNALNHPAFANPNTFGTADLSSSTFGLSTRTLGGSVGGFGGGASVYQSGGPRIMELALRLQF